MRTIMGESSHDSSFSFSSRHFKWSLKKKGGGESRSDEEENEAEEVVETIAFNNATEDSTGQKKRGSGPAARLFGFAFLADLRARMSSGGKAAGGLGSRVTGTLFGHRRGHVHLAFQVDPKSPPVVLIELAATTSGLVREMASGLVRIALECERKEKKGAVGGGGPAVKLLEETLWRTYCNGKKCGYAVRRECGPVDLDVLRAVEPVSMGAGVLPVPKSDANVNGQASADGEIMYMRAKFERVVGSSDSEAFYMMNPDGNGGGPELSIYLLRV